MQKVPPPSVRMTRADPTTRSRTMVKTMPAQAPPVVPCPRCGEPVTDLDMSSGWKYTTWNGTYLGTHRDSDPPVGRDGDYEAKVEPFHELDSYIVGPCGHDLHTDEAMPVLTAFEEWRVARRAEEVARLSKTLADDIRAAGSDSPTDLAAFLAAKGWRR